MTPVGGKNGKGMEPLPPEEVDLSEIQNTDHEAPAESRQYAGDVSLDKALSDEVKDKDPVAEKKKKKLIIGGVAGFLFVVLVIYLASGSAKSSVAQGICLTFLELETPYPHTLKVTSMEGSSTAIRLYYTNVDPFGQLKHEMIECGFGPDPVMGMKLTRVQKNRRPVEAEKIKKFNNIFAVVTNIEHNPTMPPNWVNPLVKD